MVARSRRWPRVPAATDRLQDGFGNMLVPGPSPGSLGPWLAPLPPPSSQPHENHLWRIYAETDERARSVCGALRDRERATLARIVGPLCAKCLFIETQWQPIRRRQKAFKEVAGA